jgi:hypothetical protein
MAITGGNIAFTGYQQPDYSGVVQAAGLPMQAIGQGIEDFEKASQERKKEESQINALKKSTESRIDAAINLFGDKMPGLAEQLQSQKALLNNPNISLYEQGMNASTIGSEIENTLNMLLQSQQMDIRQAAANRAAAPPVPIGPQDQAAGYTVP